MAENNRHVTAMARDRDSYSSSQKALKLDGKRPQPFEGKTEPYAHLTSVDYDARMQDWMMRVRKERIAPTLEQMQVILRVKSRVLREFEESKLGEELDEDLCTTKPRNRCEVLSMDILALAKVK